MEAKQNDGTTQSGFAQRSISITRMFCVYRHQGHTNVRIVVGLIVVVGFAVVVG